MMPVHFRFDEKASSVVNGGRGRLTSLTLRFACLALPWTAVTVGPFLVSDLAFLATCVLLIPSALALLLEPQRIRISAGWMLVVALTVFTSFLSSLGTSHSWESAMGGLRLVAIWTILRWTLAGGLRKSSEIVRAAECYIVGAAGSGLVGLLGATGLIEAATLNVGRYSGLAVHPNSQGGSLALGAVASLALFVFGRSRWPLLLAGAVCAGGTVVSGSVSGMLACGVGVACVLARGALVADRKRVLCAGAALVALAMVGVGSLLGSMDFVHPFERLTQAKGEGVGPSTITTRVWSVRTGLEGWRVHPVFGVGLDDGSGTLGDGALVHNMFVRVLFQGGVVLFCSLALALLLLLKKPDGGHAEDNGTDLRDALLLVCGAGIVFAMTGPVLFERWFWFWFLLVPLCVPRLQVLERVWGSRGRSFHANGGENMASCQGTGYSDSVRGPVPGL